jgi:DNA-directed RNA polymerase subunit RPC12/RpoP
VPDAVRSLPYKCKSCGYRTNRLGLLTVHEATHADKKGLPEHKCPDCDYRSWTKVCCFVPAAMRQEFAPAAAQHVVAGCNEHPPPL